MNDRVKVLFFANLRETTGIKETTIEFLHDSTISDIKALLLEKYPSLDQSMDTVIMAMNHEFAFDEYIVPDGAEIALFPPVSGGEKKYPNLILITERDIDINSIVEQISSSTTGAACIFSGLVRGVTRRGIPHQTEELEYEAYRIMAETKMYQITKEIRSRWDEIEGIALIQRTGKLLPGDISVIIACTASHRDSGVFEAARYGIDRLKEIVPIWKKEIDENGETWVEGNYFPQRGE